MTGPLRRRVARKAHECTAKVSAFCSPIGVGDAYLEVSTFPREGHPVRGRHCVYCAAVSDEDYRLHPVPPSQDYRYWDIDSEDLERRRSAAA